MRGLLVMWWGIQEQRIEGCYDVKYRCRCRVNTSVVERHNGTSRLRNQRKVRKTLAFSKAPRYHCWMS